MYLEEDHRLVNGLIRMGSDATDRPAPGAYLDEGKDCKGLPVLLLHGMLGDVDNWIHTRAALTGAGYRVVTPVLPVYDLPTNQTSVAGLVDFVMRLTDAIGLPPAVVVGNSLGGQVAVRLALQRPAFVRALMPTGSSGLTEVTFGSGRPRRHDRHFIRERAAHTFYDPRHAGDDLVERMHAIVTDRVRVTRLIRMARASRDERFEDELKEIRCPVHLVWGHNDRITPPYVAELFRHLIPQSRLTWIDRCGHAPMMERPEIFNGILLEWLKEVNDGR